MEKNAGPYINRRYPAGLPPELPSNTPTRHPISNIVFSRQRRWRTSAPSPSAA
uniref:Uncharacterized protein n=1 Tax=Aegilops tauschii subsp. strangulata TaxID=200361 RepID=A0A453IYR8_AEGTS